MSSPREGIKARRLSSRQVLSSRLPDRFWRGPKKPKLDEKPMQTDIDMARAPRAKKAIHPLKAGLPSSLVGRKPIGTVQVPLKFSDAYAMKVRGDCLSPRVLHGDTIVVSPSAGIGAGIIVAIAFKDGSEGKIKYLDHVPRQPRPGDEVIEMWRFLQINPRRVYFADPERIECVHAVVGVVRDGKFVAIETLVAS